MYKNFFYASFCISSAMATSQMLPSSMVIQQDFFAVDEQPVESMSEKRCVHNLETMMTDRFVGDRSQEYSVVVGGENFNLSRLWCEEPWTTKAACIKSAYKYLAQRDEVPTHENIKEIFSSCFRFFEEEDKTQALLKNVYDLSCLVLKYAKEGSFQFQLAHKAVMNTAQLLRHYKPEPSFLDVCAQEVPYWGALCMACLTGITLRRPAMLIALRLCKIKTDSGLKGDLIFSAVTATLFLACGIYASYLLAYNTMLRYKQDAYERNNQVQPDANLWEIGHNEQESFGQAAELGAGK